MNKKNNQRYQLTDNKIMEVFMDLLKEKELKNISISEICKLAEINRTAFYLHFIDIIDLLEKTECYISNEFISIFTTEQTKSIGESFVGLFEYIKKHKEFYHGYLNQSNNPNFIKIFLPQELKDKRASIVKNLGYKNEKELYYHEEFFKAGLTSLIRGWLDTGCIETPKELSEIIAREYNPIHNLFDYDKTTS